MSPPNSYISSSDQPSFGDPLRRRGWFTLLWTLIWLGAIDLFIGFAFAYPEDPRNMTPNPVALYFDYGRSMEGRLRRATRPDPNRTAPITLAGWYYPLNAVERPASLDGKLITVYGMSHAVRLADAMKVLDLGRYKIRSIGAPGATTNWAFGAFLRDTRRAENKVAVLAIMSSTLPMNLSPTPMDWNTSFAMPYTADRFYVDKDTGQLSRIRPPYESFDDYVRTLENHNAWGQALNQFARTDPFYDSFLVRQSWLDNSVVARLIRRGLSQRRDRDWRGRVMSASGFKKDSEPVLVSNAIVAEFAKIARSEGVLPVIYIVDSFGYGDKLTRSLQDTLSTQNIPYLASSKFVDPQSPVNYLPDSHFTHDNDLVLAKALSDIIAKNLGRGSSDKKSLKGSSTRD